MLPECQQQLRDIETTEGIEVNRMIALKKDDFQQHPRWATLSSGPAVRTNRSSGLAERKRTIFVVHASDFLTDYRSHGDGLVAFGFIKHLAARGHRLLVATRRTELRGPLPSNVTVFQLPGKVGVAPWDRVEYMVRVRLLFEQLRRSHSIDVIHQMNPVFTGISLSMAFSGLPLVLGTFVPQWPEAIEVRSRRLPGTVQVRATAKKLICRFQQRMASALMLTSPAALDRIAHREEMTAKLFSLQHGIDTDLFSPDPDRAPGPVRAQSPTILFYANVLARKGVFVLLRAFGQLARALPRCRLVIAGSGPDLWRVKRDAENMSAGSRIDFLGFVDHSRAPELLRQHDVYCLPSFGEPYGMTILEAMSCGRPVVASNAGGVPYLLPEDGARLVPVGDAPALAQALIEVASNPELQAAMGKANRNRVEEMFAWPQVAVELEKIYEHVLQQDRRNDPPPDRDQVQSRIRIQGRGSPRLTRSTS
jgi:glycosyltransferase involved in cell wall biosynthesis